MSTVLIVLAVVAGVAIILIGWVAGIYNGLITARNQYQNAFAQIDVQLKRRYDLIPNLVEAVRGYMKHESGTLEEITRARSAAMGAQQRASNDPTDPEAMKSLATADNQLNGALGRLMVSVEAYPDLKANQNMLSLQEELTSTENKVSFSRQGYNDAATLYNTKRDMFPTNIIAGIFNFKSATLWIIEDAAQKEAPKVQF
ncbi:MAG: LemA family protein [Planctomycetia bacterium]|nr:LemA family protein [Planctomycetia bacterium]